MFVFGGKSFVCALEYTIQYFAENCNRYSADFEFFSQWEGKRLEKQKRWQTAGLLLTAAVGLWLFLRLFGPVLLPFAVGLVIAKIADPAVRRLSRRCRLPRWAASGLCVTAVYGVLGVGLYFLCRILCAELQGFLRTLPALASSMADPVARLEDRLLSLASRFPDGLGQGLQEGISGFFKSGAGLAQKLYTWLFSAASHLLMKAPDIALFLLTAVLSSFMLSAELPGLLELWRKKAPAAWRRRGEAVLRRLKGTLGGWCKAQLKLMAVTFLILTVGFLLFQVEYPLLFSTAIAVIDALPVFGTGTVLIPWGLLAFLRGNTFLGVGLLCLYGTAALVRSALEPRMIGRQIGLDPLATLLALYAGYHFLGMPGMAVFPVGAILAKQFWNHMERKGGEDSM